MDKPIYIKFAAPAVLIVVFLVTFFLVIPQYNKVKKARQSLSKEKVKIEKLKEKAQALQGLNEYELSEKAEIALKALPAKKDVFQAMGVISRLARETGVIIEKLSASPGEISEETPSKTTPPEGKLAFKLELLGTQEQFHAFLEKLSEFIPLVDTKKVRLRTSEEVASSEFTLELYFSPLPKLLGKPETPLPKLTQEEERTFEMISTLSYYVSEEALAPAPGPSGRANPFTF